MTYRPQGTSEFDARAFRTVMGQFCTGVTVITTMVDDKPVGFACQSFAALSIDPPLGLFCPMKQSGTWAAIQKSEKFCVNVLSNNQENISGVFGSRGDDKFAKVEWDNSPLGLPILRHSITWIDFTLDRVLDGGDHDIAIGRVHSLGEVLQDRPLLFYRGGYLSTEHPRVTPAQAELENFLTWNGDSTWL